METIVEELHRELLRARKNIDTDDAYAVRFHLKQAYTYGLDIPGFIEHTTADTTDDIPAEVGRLRNALDGALVCPSGDRGDFITQALDASSELLDADAGDDNDE